MSRRGFTLIELLVVIAIIAILAAILFPVFARAREKARQNSCLSNCKQISLAVLQYAQDFDERFPKCYSAFNGAGSAVRWYWYSDTFPGSLWPYVKNRQVYVCPSSTPGDYGVNPVLMIQGGNSGRAMAEIAKPAETILLADVTARGGDYTTGMGGSGQGGSELRPPTAANVTAVGPGTACNCRSLWAPRHNGLANVAFADGHCKCMRWEATLTPESMWDLL